MQKKRYIPHAWEHVNCPYCGFNETKLHEKFGSDLQFTYAKCLKCGLIYQTPRPKYDEVFLKDAYGDYYHFDTDYTYSQKDLIGWEKELNNIFHFDKKRESILDIGSSMGDFLKVAQKYYSNCVGVDVAENMAEFARNELKVKIHVGDYLKIDFEEKFSCVHMSHVIEHIPNPVDWIGKTKEILDKDGILAMSVPNMHSLDRRFKLSMKRLGLTKGKWPENWRTPDHLFEPTISSTLRFLGDNGFRVLDYYTYSRKDMDASTLFGKIYNRRLTFGSNLRFFATPVD